MIVSILRLACGAIVVLVLSITECLAAPAQEADSAAIAEATGAQQLMKLPVRVVCPDGKPVAKAKVTPWALRSSQGHGAWRKDDKYAKVGPEDVFTDEDGKATVNYPYFRYVDERVRTIQVSINVNHPEFAYVDSLHIDVPHEGGKPHVVTLSAGVPVDVRPLVNGESVDLENVFALWSDGRSWSKDAAPIKTSQGVLHIPPMGPGENSLLLVKLDGDKATHFSAITDFVLKTGEDTSIEVSLLPGVRIEGEFSEDVPRPVRNGRVKVLTLDPDSKNYRRVGWSTWAPVQEDGTFVIEAWPADEPLQLIALCDGYIAKSGKPPEVVKDYRLPDSFERPQVFEPDSDERINVEMTPLVPCVVTAIDEDEKPVAGVSITSWPNVGWWNGGSQVYCHPLVRSEQLLRVRNYFSAVDEQAAFPFKAQTDGSGQATLELPAGSEYLAVESDVYELPVFLGERDVPVKLTAGETTEVTLRLQPRGTEQLGEWDKLAGVVFGCSTREGRRICALPGVRKQMDEFQERFREAKNQRDPQLLSEAYTVVADAFVGVGDLVEAEKWRKKAAEQAAKVKDTDERSDRP